MEATVHSKFYLSDSIESGHFLWLILWYVERYAIPLLLLKADFNFIWIPSWFEDFWDSYVLHLDCDFVNFCLLFFISFVVALGLRGCLWCFNNISLVNIPPLPSTSCFVHTQEAKASVVFKAMQLKWTNCIACICIGTTPEGYNLFPVLSSASSSTLSASILVTLNSILVLRIQPLPACIPKSGLWLLIFSQYYMLLKTNKQSEYFNDSDNLFRLEMKRNVKKWCSIYGVRLLCLIVFFISSLVLVPSTTIVIT